MNINKIKIFMNKFRFIILLSVISFFTSCYGIKKQVAMKINKQELFGTWKNDSVTYKFTKDSLFIDDNIEGNCYKYIIKNNIVYLYDFFGQAEPIEIIKVTKTKLIICDTDTQDTYIFNKK